MAMVLTSYLLLHYIPWILSMYTYCMHFSQSHQAPQNKTASGRQKAKFTTPILSRFPPLPGRVLEYSCLQ